MTKINATIKAGKGIEADAPSDAFYMVLFAEFDWEQVFRLDAVSVKKLHEVLGAWLIRDSAPELELERASLVPTQEYGSEGHRPLEGYCPRKEESDPSCISGSGGSVCGGFMGCRRDKQTNKLFTICQDGGMS